MCFDFSVLFFFFDQVGKVGVHGWLQVSSALTVSEDILDEYCLAPSCTQLILGALLRRTQEDSSCNLLFCFV